MPLNYMGLFRRKSNVYAASRSVNTGEEIRARGTPMRAVVSDVIVKRNGYIVVAIYEDRELGTQHSYKSNLLKEVPCVHIGGEVIVYVDDVDADGDYYVDCE